MKYFALMLGKIAIFLLKIINKNGGSLPGKIAIKYCPDILKYFKYPKKTILITGTNGKTSTTNLIDQLFSQTNAKVISNSKGDNIINGIVSVLIKNASFNFKVNADVLVLEVDESTLAKNVQYINATDIVITNFFRDQLDRVGEMESVISKIQNALIDYSGRLYLNNDDPNVYRFSKFIKKANILTFGIGITPNTNEKNNEAKEGKFCPICSNELKYDYYHYSHIGKFTCTNCDFYNEKSDFSVSSINYENNSFIIDVSREKSYEFHYSISATYHIYNLIAAASVAMTNNIPVDIIDKVFTNFILGIGRMEYIDVKGKKILLNLVKNPTGCNEVIKYIENNKTKKSFIFLLNDKYADGQDISWIWDVDFEDIRNLETIILTGKRAYEAAIRFKIARVCDNIIVEKDLDKAIDILILQDTTNYVISTYTGLFDIRNRLINKK